MSNRTQGIALVTSLIFVTFAAVVISTVFLLTTQSMTSTGDLVRTTQAQYAAEAGVEKVIQLYYYDLMSGVEKKDLKLSKYRETLSAFNSGILKPSITAVADSVTGDDTFSSNTIVLTGTTEDGQFIVTLSRKDINAPRRFSANSSRRTELNVRAMGLTAGAIDLTTVPSSNPFSVVPAAKTKRVLSQTLFITDASFKGVDYALLSNNVNCIFCHTYVTTMEDAYNPGRTNRLDRVKIATLESLEVRQGTQADTYIGGTIYTRGEFRRDPLGGGGSGAYVAGDLAGLGVKTHDVSLADALIGTTQSNLAWQDCASSCVKNMNFYKNYPATGGVDGDIPESFPSPIYDANNNRKIDDTEWKNTIKAEDGGNVKGGQKQLFPLNTTYVSTQLTTPTLSVNYSVSNNGIDGNLVMTGTLADPLNLNGTIFVNGDVIISGRTTGSGTIISRGNIYVVGDLEYACPQATTPVTYKACDYKIPANLPKLALIAGSNVVIGDAYTPRVRFQNGGTWIPQPNGTAVTAPQTYLGVRVAGYVEPVVTRVVNGVRLWYSGMGTTGSYAGLSKYTDVTASSSSNFSASFVTGEIGAFNRSERNKANASSAYVPRFYAFGGDPFYILDTYEEAKNYKNVNVVEQTLIDRGAVYDMAPGKMTSLVPWISLTQLKAFWVTNVETPTRATTTYTASNLARYSSNTSSQAKPLQVDALLYSSNAIFSLARADSKVQGSTIINGSIVAADTGFLSSGRDGSNNTYYPNMQYGLRVQYDSRLASIAGLGQGLSLMRSNYALEKQ